MRWTTRPGWPGNLLAVAAGAITTFALAPFNIWPLALLAVGLFYAGLRELKPRQALGRGWCFGFGLFGAGTSWIYYSIHHFGGASVLLAGFLMLLFTAAIAFLRAARVALGTLVTPQRSTAGRRAGVCRAVGRPGGISRLVPHRFPVALFRIQPARRPIVRARAGRWHVAGVLRIGPDCGTDLQRTAPAQQRSKRFYRGWFAVAGRAVGCRHCPQGSRLDQSVRRAADGCRDSGQRRTKHEMGPGRAQRTTGAVPRPELSLEAGGPADLAGNRCAGPQRVCRRLSEHDGHVRRRA